MAGTEQAGASSGRVKAPETGPELPGPRSRKGVRKAMVFEKTRRPEINTLPAPVPGRNGTE